MSQVKPINNPDILSAWYSTRPVIPERDYQKTVLPRITALENRDGFRVQQYGEASYGEGAKHPLMRVLVGDFSAEKETVIFTTTHGYEKGGPLALLSFLENEAAEYSEKVNIVVYPCMAPGPYEKNLRYTVGRKDTNRDAVEGRLETQEIAAFAVSIEQLRQELFGDDLTRKFAKSVDLHETPPEDYDIDREEAIMSKTPLKQRDIPYGYYVITDSDGASLARDILGSTERGGTPTIEGDDIMGLPADHGVVFMEDVLEIAPNLKGTTMQFMAGYARASVTTEMCFPKSLSDNARKNPQLNAIRGTLSEYVV